MDEPSLTTKKLSPLILTSRAPPVVCVAPAALILVVVDPKATPRPICFALIPPVPVKALAPEALCVVWYIISLNVTDDDLNAKVFTLAILLPITSILIWCVFNPDTPEYNDLIIIVFLLL